MSNPGEPFGGLGGDAARGFGAHFEQAQKMQAAMIDAQQELTTPQAPHLSWARRAASTSAGSSGTRTSEHATNPEGG
ncbi:hypothetical protein [Pseudofrankia inefficax]|uniref:Uncharacterized protein n=1 Tax=Pseudofrankia inefficax (strain DSM 45817 / CECT 9037 / DDB 130130 / EuI1c) TaxID=298654 RepID=E3J8Q6_PSEI1|nr:hypothetical protein [Pseudofrankia inefficax]ADP78499.1 hypothetical protein FraEuI1c_0413 [Pseudofrankia inefficax]